MRSFEAVIEDAGGGGAFVRIPFDVEQTYGKKRVKVRADIEGEIYRGSLVRMGTDCHILGVRKDIRLKIGKTIGDTVHISLQEDLEPREVGIPQDLMDTFQRDPIADAKFQRLSYSHQRETVQWIEQAKRPQTHQKRIAGAVAMLKQDTHST